MKNCLRCGQPFQPKDDRPSRPARYCSRACGQPNRKARVVLTCRHCRQQFERKRYMRAWSQERGPFCSFGCYGAWQAANVLGQKNPNFVPASPARGSGQWERNRLAALDRDGHRCARCGAPDRLHVHHVQHWELGQNDPHALDNLETLCASCHRRAHPMRQGPGGRFLPNR